MTNSAQDDVENNVKVEHNNSIVKKDHNIILYEKEL